MNMRIIHQTQGNAQVGYAIIAGAVGLVGLAGMTSLGGSMEEAIGGEASAVAAIEQGDSPLWGTVPAGRPPAVPNVGPSVQSAIAFLRAAKSLASGALDVAALGDEVTESLRGAKAAANDGRVLEARRLIDRARDLADDEAHNDPRFRDLTDAILDLAHESSTPAVRTLNRGNLRVVRDLLYSDGRTRAAMEAVYLDADRLVRSVGSAASDATLEERFAWIPLMNDKESRRLILRAIRDDRAEASAGLWRRLRDGSSDPVVYDVLHVGAGVTNSHAANVIALANPDVRQLVVEAGDVVSANFRNGGDAFAYNMTNRQRILGRETGPGNIANLAPIESPVNPADLSFRKYAPAVTWAESAEVALRVSDADTLVQTRVERIRRADADAAGRYEITVTQGGNTSVVYADRVSLGTGVGRFDTKKFDAATIDFLGQEFARFDRNDPSQVPLVMTASNELYMAGEHVEWADTYTTNGEGVDAYIGIGDSTFTALEERLRLAFDGDDRRVAQRGIIEGADFYVGSDGPRNAEELLKGRAGSKKWAVGIRTRYGDIFTAAKKADVAGKTVPESLQLIDGKVTSIRRTADGKVAVTDANGVERIYRRVILGTGYNVDVGPLLEDFIASNSYEGPLQKSGLLEAVSPSNEPGFNLARKVPGEEIYVTGVAAGTDLIPTKELAGVVENNAALFNWLPRVTRLMRDRFTTARDLPKVEYERTPFRLNDLIPGEGFQQSFNTQRLDDTKTPVSRLALLYEMAKELRRSKVANAPEGFDLEFRATRNRRAVYDFAGSTASATFIDLVGNAEYPGWSFGPDGGGTLATLFNRFVRRDRPLKVTVSARDEGAARYGLEPGSFRWDTMQIEN